MLASEDHGEVLKRASYPAYTDTVETAHRTLSDSVSRYVDEHREFYDRETLDFPINFQPLKDYERTLTIQKLTLQLALRTADQIEHKSATVSANGHNPPSVGPAPSRTPEPRQAP
jgi:hypothetical protein